MTCASTGQPDLSEGAWDGWLPHPNPTALSIWAAKGRCCSVFAGAASSKGQGAEHGLTAVCKVLSLLSCKTNSETTSEGYAGAGKLPSSYIPKQEKVLQFWHFLLQCCLPASFKFPFLLFNKCISYYLSDSCWRMLGEWLPNLFSWGCCFWAQDRGFVVMPLDLNPALTAACQLLAEGLRTRDSYSFLWKSWTGVQGQALPPWADTVSLYGLEG